MLDVIKEVVFYSFFCLYKILKVKWYFLVREMYRGIERVKSVRRYVVRSGMWKLLNWKYLGLGYRIVWIGGILVGEKWEISI